MNTEKLETFLVESLINGSPHSRGLSVVYSRALLALVRGYRLETLDIKKYLMNFLDDQRSQLEKELSEDWWIDPDYENQNDNDEINMERKRYYRDRDAALNAIEGFLR